MDTTTASKRLHPLMALAAVSVTLVSIVGAAAIAGILPSSHRAVATQNPTSESSGNGNAPVIADVAPQPVAREVVQHRTALHHDYLRPQVAPQATGDNQMAQAQPPHGYPQAPPPQQPAPVAQYSPVGIGIGAVVGGLVGSRVGGGNGRTLAAIAGAVGGGYLGNEIATQNQKTDQQ